MLKVAICDDNEDFTKRIEEHTEHFSHENNIDVKVSRFISGPQLMLSYFYRKYDIIFLDITMPEMDGFETAERIRKIDSNVAIIFCSSFYNLQNLQKCVQVEAKDFLGKPVLYRKIELILNKVYNKKIINAEEKLMLKTQEGIIALQISDIIYMETENKAVVIHTANRNIVTYKKLYEFEKRLGDRLFYRCHQGYLVNLDYVERVQEDSLILKEKVTIPVSKSKKEELLKKMAKYVAYQL